MANHTKILNQLPKTPGVYLFKDAAGQIIYVGKAINLYRRVHQYFTNNRRWETKIKNLVAQIDQIKTIPTLSEFDAILLEAKLIRQWQPKYNSISRDDASPLYIYLTLAEPLPRVQVMRKSLLIREETRGNLVFGPFPSSRATRLLLRQLRHVIPFCTQKKRNGQSCFYTQLGLCGPCPSQISQMVEGKRKRDLTKRYRHQIRLLGKILSGKARLVLSQLDREMTNLARHERFEEAEALKRQIHSLHQLLATSYDPEIYLDKAQAVEDLASAEAQELFTVLRGFYPQLTPLSRIEAVDISNIMGQWATGSLVVATDGQINKSEYRRFRIRGRAAPNDTAMIAHVLRRRLGHREWPKPNLWVIDGGKPQLKQTLKVLAEHRLDTPAIGLAKRQEEIIVFDGQSFRAIRLPLNSPALHLLQRLRDEAHRFALSYHRLLRKKTISVP